MQITVDLYSSHLKLRFPRWVKNEWRSSAEDLKMSLVLNKSHTVPL